MSDPLPPEATTVPAPRRVQFTMRTFFVAAVWISAVFAARKCFSTEVAVVCITLLVVIGFYGVYSILRASCARIAIAIGTLAMLLGCVPIPFTNIPTTENPLLALHVVAVGWGVFFSIVVGIVRALVLRVRRGKKRHWCRFWRREPVERNEKPRSEAWAMAWALAGAHFRWSVYLLLLGWLLQQSLSYAYSQQCDMSAVFRFALTGLALLDAPGVPLFVLIMDTLRPVRFSSGVGLWTISSLLGVLLYLVLGWLMGWALDTFPEYSCQPLPTAESCEDSDGNCDQEDGTTSAPSPPSVNSAGSR